MLLSCSRPKHALRAVVMRAVHTRRTPETERVLFAGQSSARTRIAKLAVFFWPAMRPLLHRFRIFSFSRFLWGVNLVCAYVAVVLVVREFSGFYVDFFLFFLFLLRKLVKLFFASH